MCKKSHGDYFEKDNNDKKVYLAYIVWESMNCESHIRKAVNKVVMV
jgi:hypothetical protein